MKNWLLAVGLLAIGGHALAAAKPCEELKSEIDAKIKAKGASGYSLEIVDKGAAGSAKVVGTCDSGRKVIVYSRK